MRGNSTTMFRITRSVKPGLLLGVICVVLLAAASSGAQTINVLDGETGLAIAGGFRWTLEEDTTYHVPRDQDGAVAPGLDPNWDPYPGHTLSLSFHKSYFPLAGQGVNGEPLPALATPKNYYISVLPDSDYSIGGAQILYDGTKYPSVVDVYVNPLPIPTAQISVFVFEDNFPTNNAADTATLALPGGATEVVEDGIPGFQIILEDAGGRYGASAGQAIMDAFGHPLGTTYFDPCPGASTAYDDACVDTLGTGVVFTDADGWVMIENLAPAKYGLIVVPPAGQGWQQTTTIEGTIVIDAWVKANEPRFFAEFGPPGPHVFMGFVQVDPETMDWSDVTTLTGGANISGQVVNRHLSRPPQTAFYPGAPVEHTTPWVALNDLGQGPNGKAVYIGETDGGAFTINGVPDGTYQLAVFDANLDFVIGLQNITVGPADPIRPPTCLSGGACDLQEVAVNQWFTRLEHDVFTDLNQNGFWDADEPALLEQNVNLRWRNGDINQAMATDGEGFVPFDEVFPFFSWQVAEVDYARGKPTGVTVTVDGGGEIPTAGITAEWSMGGQLNPQLQEDAGFEGSPYRTETGPVLTQAYQGFLGQTSVISWGKFPWGPGENGGISGMVLYATTRAEDDPRWAAAEPWEPGIPNIPVHLYRDINLDGLPDPGGPILSTLTDSWDANLPEGCVNPADDQFFINNPTVDCFDGLRSFNQVRPGVFDGGYAFGPEIDCDGNDACIVSTHVVDSVRYLNPGGYIVAVEKGNYHLLKEEDRNVDFGDEYVPSTLLTPPVCVGNVREVPLELTLFPGVEVGSGFGGTDRPLCDRKQVLLSGGANAAADFFLFTDAPISGHIVGFILDDLANEFDPNSVQFGEKYAPPFLPVSLHDWTGRQISRVYSDIYGRYNLPVPSTYTANLPMPSGMSPNMLTACMNGMMQPDPDNPGAYIRDILHNPQYSQFCYTFQYMPGTTTYLDTPVVPVAAFAGPGQFPVDCDPPAGTPGIASVTNGANGPWVPSAGGNLTITSMGVVEVPNPDYCPSSDQSCENAGFTLPINDVKTVPRDYSFGPDATVSLGGTALTCNPGAVPDSLDCTVPPMAEGRYQLTVANLAGESEIGVSVNIDDVLPTTVVASADPAATPIQDAIDAASPGDLITVAEGTYNEIVVMWKPVRLQGWGAGSVNINAVNIPMEKIQLWREKIDGLIAGNDVDVLPGQEVAGQQVGVAANTLGTEQAPGIIVLGKRTGNARFSKNQSHIDGFAIFGSSTGGGIIVNAYAGTDKNPKKDEENALRITNNRIENNAGFYSGGIRLGHPNVIDEQGNNLQYADAMNRDITIANNQVFRNGGLDGVGGGISLYTGSDRYRVAENRVCGNFTLGHGGGVGHFGLSEDGVIEDNTIILNENFNQGPIINVHGGGLYIGGAPGIVLGDLTAGSGDVTVARNLFQGNMAGAGDGGGIALDAINGEDLKPNSKHWWAIDVVNNTIVNNIAGGAGGGISLQDTAAVRIAHNTVARNDSTATTGGLVVNGASLPQPAGIVSFAHSAELEAKYGGVFSDPELVDTVVFENRSFNVATDTDTGMFVLEPQPPTPWNYSDLGVIGVSGEQLAPLYCVLTDPTGYDASNISGGSASSLFAAPAINTKRLTNMQQEKSLQITVAPDEGGNFIRVVFGIALDPGTDYGRLSPQGDFHLNAGSPAIDQANDLSPAVTDDIDGDARPGGGNNDIGSDESAFGNKATQGQTNRRNAGRRVGGGS